MYSCNCGKKKTYGTGQVRSGQERGKTDTDPASFKVPLRFIPSAESSTAQLLDKKLVILLNNSKTQLCNTLLGTSYLSTLPSLDCFDFLQTVFSPPWLRLRLGFSSLSLFPSSPCLTVTAVIMDVNAVLLGTLDASEYRFLYDI